MLEVNAIYFILFLELWLVWLLVTLIRRRRKRKDIAELAEIKGRSSMRKQQAEFFLQVVYQLEGEGLNNTLNDIDKHETEFSGI